jgi:hypothetical protein
MPGIDPAAFSFAGTRLIGRIEPLLTVRPSEKIGQGVQNPSAKFEKRGT